MTALTDIKAVTPTANAKSAIQAKGAQVGDLMMLLQQHAIEMQMLIKQVIALTPSGDATLTALSNILAELA
jgi:hypothetical protein